MYRFKFVPWPPIALPYPLHLAPIAGELVHTKGPSMRERGGESTSGAPELEGLSSSARRSPAAPMIAGDLL
jgi:hypothetical protein